MAAYEWAYPANTNVFLTLARGCGFVIFVLIFIKRFYMVLIILVSIIMLQERSENDLMNNNKNTET